MSEFICIANPDKEDFIHGVDLDVHNGLLSTLNIKVLPTSTCSIIEITGKLEKAFGKENVVSDDSDIQMLHAMNDGITGEKEILIDFNEDVDPKSVVDKLLASEVITNAFKQRINFELNNGLRERG